jgi:hypothetical protein
LIFTNSHRTSSNFWRNMRATFPSSLFISPVLFLQTASPVSIIANCCRPRCVASPIDYPACSSRNISSL